MIPSHKRSETPERPITFNAAEDLGAFRLAELWADRTAWPITERTAYDELAELATISALAGWVSRTARCHGCLALRLPGHTAVHPTSMTRACPVI